MTDRAPSRMVRPMRGAELQLPEGLALRVPDRHLERRDPGIRNRRATQESGKRHVPYPLRSAAQSLFPSHKIRRHHL